MVGKLVLFGENELSINLVRENSVKQYIVFYQTVCIPESFNTNILHQLFDYTITLVNSQRQNTNSNGIFVPKKMI